jgi:thymidylate kinase
MYIAIEGVDEVGKTTIINKIKPYLTQFIRDYELPLIKYIAETEIKTEYHFDGERARQRYLAMKYAIQRIELFEEVMPTSKIILSDRSVFSSYAYQGKYMSFDTLRDINSYIKMPDYVIFIKSSDLFDKETETEKLYFNSLDKTNTKYFVYYQHDEELWVKILEQIITLIIKEYSIAISNNWIAHNLLTKGDIE